MNHLAHLFLSGENKLWIMGNFMADFLTPSEQKAMPFGIQQGIEIHKFIDRTIDNDPVFKQSIELIRKTQRKYSPVVADIYYDYLLYEHWNKYAVIAVDVFIENAYQYLLDSLTVEIPEPIRQRISYMVERNFLRSYSSVYFMERTFEMLGNRVKFQHNLSQATADYKINQGQLNAQFEDVFPRMIKSCLEFRINLQS